MDPSVRRVIVTACSEARGILLPLAAHMLTARHPSMQAFRRITDPGDMRRVRERAGCLETLHTNGIADARSRGYAAGG
jgi:hypothetical protein